MNEYMDYLEKGDRVLLLVDPTRYSLLFPAAIGLMKTGIEVVFLNPKEVGLLNYGKWLLGKNEMKIKAIVCEPFYHFLVYVIINNISKVLAYFDNFTKKKIDKEEKKKKKKEKKKDEKKDEKKEEKKPTYIFSKRTPGLDHIFLIDYERNYLKENTSIFLKYFNYYYLQYWEKSKKAHCIDLSNLRKEEAYEHIKDGYYTTMADDCRLEFLFDRNDVVAFTNTTGSTGIPKIVCVTHGMLENQVHSMSRIVQNYFRKNNINLIGNLLNIKKQRGKVRGKRKEKENRYCQMFNHNVIIAMVCGCLGITQVIPPFNTAKPKSVNPKIYVEMLNSPKLGITELAFNSPIVWLKVIQYCFTHKIVLSKNLRLMLCGGAPVPIKLQFLLRGLSNQIGSIESKVVHNENDNYKIVDKKCQFMTPYGSTECLPMAIIGTNDIINNTYQKTCLGYGICVGKICYGLEIRILKLENCFKKINDDKESDIFKKTKLIKNDTIGHIAHNDFGNDNDKTEISLILAPNKKYIHLDQRVGHIVLCGKGCSKEYLLNDKANVHHKLKIFENKKEKTLHKTGDIGYLDEYNNLWYCGRMTHCFYINSNKLKYEIEKENYNLILPVCIEGIVNNNLFVKRSACVEKRKKIKNEETQKDQIKFFGNIPVARKCCIVVELEKNYSKILNEYLKKKIIKKIKSDLKNSIWKFLIEDNLIKVIIFPVNSELPVDKRHNSKLERLYVRDWVSKMK